MFYKIIILFYYLKTKYFHNFANRAALEKWQENKINKIILRVIAKSQFYNGYIKNPYCSPLSGLPPINKTVMMDNFDDFNTARIKLEEALKIAAKAEEDRNFSPKLGKYSVGLSSGTSGIRGVFLVSPFEQAKWCGTILGKMLPCSIFRRQKIAFFLRADNNLYESIKSNSLNFCFFDLKKDVNENIKRLGEFQPNILVAPPSMLNLIAEAQQSGDINIYPYKIISVADVLYADTAGKLESVFKQKIHQIYQATEGLIACTCKCGRLHLNEDILSVRKKYLDKPSGRFIPIITDFNRITQPIINYELNDILVESTEKCLCGSVFTGIEKIEGRCDDILYYTDNKGVKHTVFPDFIIRTILKHIPKAGDFLFAQTDINTAVLFLETNECSEGLLQALKEIIPIEITVEALQRPANLSVKRKRVVRKFNP